MKVAYASTFFRQLKKLPLDLQEEAFEKEELFKKDPKNKLLKTHKLKGRLQGSYSFSVNYKTRIIFEYLNKDKVVFISIGDHDVYKK